MNVAVADEVETKFTIAIIYNGVDKPITANPHQAVQAALQHAIDAFGTLPNAHTLALFNTNGDELDNGISIAAAGVKPGDTLLLRPSKVRGGTVL